VFFTRITRFFSNDFLWLCTTTVGFSTAVHTRLYANGLKYVMTRDDDWRSRCSLLSRDRHNPNSKTRLSLYDNRRSHVLLRINVFCLQFIFNCCFRPLLARKLRTRWNGEGGKTRTIIYNTYIYRLGVTNRNVTYEHREATGFVNHIFIYCNNPPKLENILYI